MSSTRIQTCAECGGTHHLPEPVPPPWSGPSSLDGRPDVFPVPAGVYRCPACGYCAPALAAHYPIAAAVMALPVYQRQLRRTDTPAAVCSLLCWSLIAEYRGVEGDLPGLSEGGAACVLAAWLCDDAGAGVWARQARMRAERLLRQAVDNRVAVAVDRDAEAALLIDLLRRSARFDRATVQCREALQATDAARYRRIFTFQQRLIGAGDAGSYTEAAVVA